MRLPAYFYAGLFWLNAVFAMDNLYWAANWSADIGIPQWMFYFIGLSNLWIAVTHRHWAGAFFK